MLKYLFTKLILLSWLILPAQVQVRDEPRHHNVFENEFVRILDVYLGPKDTTQYHLHNTPSVFIILSDCKVSSQLLGAQPQPGANVSGNVSYDEMKTERIHRVWNEDTIWFHVLDVELIAKSQNKKVIVFQNPFVRLLFNTQQVNGYSVDVSPGKNLQIPPSANGYLLVSLDACFADITMNNKTQHRMLKAGHYHWIEYGKPLTMSISGPAAGKFVLLQLK